MNGYLISLSGMERLSEPRFGNSMVEDNPGRRVPRMLSLRIKGQASRQGSDYDNRGDLNNQDAFLLHCMRPHSAGQYPSSHLTDHVFSVASNAFVAGVA